MIFLLQAGLLLELCSLTSGTVRVRKSRNSGAFQECPRSRIFNSPVRRIPLVRTRATFSRNQMNLEKESSQAVGLSHCIPASSMCAR